MAVNVPGVGQVAGGALVRGQSILQTKRMLLEARESVFLTAPAHPLESTTAEFIHAGVDGTEYMPEFVGGYRKNRKGIFSSTLEKKCGCDCMASLVSSSPADCCSGGRSSSSRRRAVRRLGRGPHARALLVSVRARSLKISGSNVDVCSMGDCGQSVEQETRFWSYSVIPQHPTEEQPCGAGEVPRFANTSA